LVQRNQAGTSSLAHVHRHRVEDVQAEQGDLIPGGAALRGRVEAPERDVRGPAHAEELTGAHVLEQVAHEQVGGGLHVGGRGAGHLLAAVDQLAGVGLDGETDHVQVGEPLGARLAGRLVDQALADGPVLRPEHEGHRLAVPVPHQRLRRQGERLGRGPDLVERDRPVAVQPDDGAFPQHLPHPLGEGLFPVALFGAPGRRPLQVSGQRDGPFDGERARDPRDGLRDFGAVHQDFLFGRFVVGDALEGDVGDDAPDLLAAPVLPAAVDEPRARAVGIILQLIPGERGGE
jgi:hypothetical protein